MTGWRQRCPYQFQKHHRPSGRTGCPSSAASCVGPGRGQRAAHGGGASQLEAYSMHSGHDGGGNRRGRADGDGWIGVEREVLAGCGRMAEGWKRRCVDGAAGERKGQSKQRRSHRAKKLPGSTARRNELWLVPRLAWEGCEALRPPLLPCKTPISPPWFGFRESSSSCQSVRASPSSPGSVVPLFLAARHWPSQPPFSGLGAPRSLRHAMSLAPKTFPNAYYVR